MSGTQLLFIVLTIVLAVVFLVSLIIQMRNIHFPSFSFKKSVSPFKNFLNLFIYNRKRERVKEIFKRTHSLIRKHKEGTFYKYPVYIIVGKEKCHLDEIIKNGAQQLPFGRPYIKEGDPCAIWVSNRGIYIQIEIENAADDESFAAFEEILKYVISNLKRYRKRRKLDGLIMAYDCQEIMQRKESEEGEESAETTAEPKETVELKLLNCCLKLISYRLSYQIPLYFMIANSEYIVGLKTLAQTILPEDVCQIVGWTYGGSEPVIRMDMAVKSAIDEMRDKVESIKDYLFKSSDLNCNDQDAIFVKEYISDLLLRFSTKVSDKYNPEIRGDDRFVIRGIYLTLNYEKSLGQKNVIFVRDFFDKLLYFDFGFGGKVVKTNTIVDLAKNIGVYTVLTLMPLVLYFADKTLDNRVKAIDVPLQNVAEQLQDQTLYTEKDPNDWKNLYASTEKPEWYVLNVLIPASWVSPIALRLPSEMLSIAAISLSNTLYYTVQSEMDLISQIESEANSGMTDDNTQSYLQFTPLKKAVSDAENILNMVSLQNNVSLNSDTDQVADLMRTNDENSAPAEAPQKKSLANKLIAKKEKTLAKKLPTTKAAQPPEISPDTLKRFDKLRNQGSLKIYNYSDTKKTLNIRLLNLFGVYGETLLRDWPLTKNLNVIQELLAQSVKSRLSMQDIDTLRLALNSVVQISNLAAGPSKVKTISDGKLFRLGINNYLEALESAKDKNLISLDEYNNLLRKYSDPFKEEVKYNFGYSISLVGQVYPYDKMERANILSPRLLSLLNVVNYIDKYNFHVTSAPNSMESEQLLRQGAFLIGLPQLQKLEGIIEKYSSFDAERKKIKNPDEGFYTDLLLKKTVDTEVSQVALSSILPIVNFQSQRNLLVNQSNNAVNVYAPLTKITKALDTANLPTARATVFKIITSLAVKILQLAKENLMALELYMPAEKLDINSKSETLLTQAYNTDTVSDLKSYLASQAALVISEGVHYAQPALDLLKLVPKNYLQLSDANMSLIQFWQNTATYSSGKAAAVAAKGKAASPPAELNQFIMTDINKIDLANCSTVLTGRASGNDFYSLTLNELKQQMYTMCQKQADFLSNSKYEKIVTAFNAYLLGNFPFVAPHNFSAPSVPYDTLTEFYTTYSKDIEFLIKIYKAQKNNPIDEQRLTFLTKLNDSLTFLLANVKTNVTLPQFYVKFTYRINKANELGADQILGWNFSDSNGTLSPTSKAKQILWQYGDSVSFELMWASDSPEVPKPPGADDLSIQGLNATFGSVDPWSLLKFIAMHRTSMFPENQKLGTSLVFEIPTMKNDEKGVNSIMTRSNLVRVYAALQLLDGKTLKPLVMPEFPYQPPVALGKVQAVNTTPRVYVDEGYRERKVSKSHNLYDIFSKDNPHMIKNPDEKFDEHNEKSYFPKRTEYEKQHKNNADEDSSTQKSIPKVEDSNPPAATGATGAPPQSTPADPESNLSMDLDTKSYEGVNNVDKECYKFKTQCSTAINSNAADCEYCCKNASRMFLSTLGFKCLNENP